MAVSSTTGGLRTGVCLSTDRPQNPYNGQVIYETDTNRTLVWDNSAWVVVADPALVSFSGSAASVTGNLTGNVTGNVTGDVTGDLTGDVAASAVTIGGENVTPYTGRRNLLYNGAMQVAQRGTSATGITSTGYKTVDRWNNVISGAGTWTETVESDAPDGFSNSVKFNCTTANASLAAGAYFVKAQSLEGQDLQCLAKGTSSAKPFTATFWVKSNVTGTYIVEFIDNDSLRRISASYTISSSGSWEKKTILIPGDTIGQFDNDNNTSLVVQWWLAVGSDRSGGSSLNTSWSIPSTADRAVGQTNLASAVNNYWQITGVQLEVGDKATPFEHRSYGEELALCQRYYEKSYDMGKNPSPTNDPNGSINVWPYTTTANRVHIYAPFSVRKRATPTVTMYDTATGTAGYFMEDSFGLRAGQVIFIGETGFTMRNSVVLAGTGYILAHFIASAEL